MELAPFKPKTLLWLRVFAALSVLGWIDLLAGDTLPRKLTRLVGFPLGYELALAISVAVGGGALCLMIAAILHVVRRKLGFWKTILLILVLGFGGGVTPVFYFWFIWKPSTTPTPW